jgi:hypothetical protein
MKFKELIAKYTFDDIVPALQSYWDKGNLFLFREAFDILRLMPTHATEDSAIIIKHYKQRNEEYDNVYNLAGCYSWAECLECEIVTEDDVHLTEKQILALCLWDRTYYGFSPEQENEEVDSWKDPILEGITPPDNPYFRRHVQLARCRYRRRVKPRDRSYDAWGFPLWPSEYIISHRHTKQCSRDRKAVLRYRSKRRYLAKMSDTIEIIKDIISKYSDLHFDDLKFMLQCDDYSRQCFKSQVKDLKDAVSYIVDSLLLYSDLPLSSSDNHVIALICLPEDFTLSDTDKSLITESIKKKIGKQPDIIVQRNTSETENVRLTIIQSICK